MDSLLITNIIQIIAQMYNDYYYYYYFEDGPSTEYYQLTGT